MRAAIRGLAAPHHPAGDVAAWSSLPALYHRWAMTAGGERYVVALRGGRIVGYAASRADELTALFVVPQAARTGVGAALVERVAAALRRRGARALRVVAAHGAEPFYARAGFVAGRAARVPLPGGGALAARRMRRRLDRAERRR